MKKTFFAFLATIPLLLSSCNGLSAESVEQSDHFSIEANSTVYHTDVSDTQQVKISVAAGAVLKEHPISRLRVVADSNECYANFVKVKDEDAYYFVPRMKGRDTIKAMIGDLVSDNTIVITAKDTEASVAENLENVLDTKGGVVFGQEYDIGIAASEASSYQIQGADGIVRINSEGKLDICGIGQGKLKLMQGSSVVFDGRYTVYNSVLATKIKEDLISQGKIESKSSLVTNDLLSFIKSLDLEGELVNDPSASYGVKYLNKLEVLNLSDNGLSDASFISSISTLKELDLSNNNFSNISSIVENENLEYLNLSNNSLSEITKLQFLYKIKELDLSDNFITDISPLSSSYSLVSLKLNNNRIQNFRDSLSGLEDLRELYVGNCGIPFTDIISLRYLPNITSLDISGTDPTLENLSRLSRLEKLILEHCNLGDKNLSALNNLVDLKFLDISNNDIDAEAYGSGLDSGRLTKIETLAMGGNAFDNIPDLSGFTQLKKLDLSYSYNLVDLSSLNGLPIAELMLDNSNSLDPTSFLNLLNSLTALEKLSVVGGFSYINEALYNQLVGEVESGNLKLRFLDRDYIDNLTISNYKRCVLFSLSSLLNLCTLEDNAYVIPDFGDSRQLILSLVNDTDVSATSPYKFVIGRTLSRLDIFGNVYTTYDLRFSVSNRNESTFTFGFHNFKDAISVNEPLISSAVGSKIVITGDGESSLCGATLQENPTSLISCYDIYIKYPKYPNTSLIIRGFTGAKGTKGKNADTNDMSVKNGKVGHKGGTAIDCNFISIRVSGAKIYGGTGGEGGDGGKSTAGPIAIISEYRAGGKGGNGGDGGTCIRCVKYEILDQSILFGGPGGKGGTGGQGLDKKASDGGTGATGETIVMVR